MLMWRHFLLLPVEQIYLLVDGENPVRADEPNNYEPVEGARNEFSEGALPITPH
jgi:hypothetical protein